MNVEQIKQIESLADVYQLNPEHLTIIRLPKNTPQVAAQKCCEMVNDMGCKALVFRSDTKLDMFQYTEQSQIKKEKGE